MYIKSRSEGFGREVRRRIMLGNFVLSAGYYDAYYNKALRARRVIRDTLSDAFKKYDFIAGAVYPSTAPKLGEGLDDPLKTYIGDAYTVPANLAGLPAISVPCGKNSRASAHGGTVRGRESFGRGKMSDPVTFKNLQSMIVLNKFEDTAKRSRTAQCL